MYSPASTIDRFRRLGACFNSNCGLRCALLALMLTVGATEATAQCKLTASDANGGDLFGWSVSVSGNTAITGVINDDCTAGGVCGSAYIYRFDGTIWTEEAKLFASDAAQSDLFGYSVSIDGTVAVVGAWFDDCAGGENCGAAYVFRFDGADWLEEAKLTASDADAGDRFGISTSVSGGTVVVGGYRDACAAGTWCGAAYVYRFDGASWVEQAKLTASDAGDGDFFGISVAVAGETAVVGAYNDDCTAGSWCGSAYVFRFDGASWLEEAKLTASTPAAFDQFGFSVSMSGNAIAVGAFNVDCAAGSSCGATYVFRFDGASWEEEAELTASDAAPLDAFGQSVSIDGNTVAVGAYRDDCAAGADCGAAYVYRFNGASWTEDAKLTTSGAAADDQLGFSVSVSGDTTVVGAFLEDCTAGTDCGSMYAFRLVGTCGNGIVDPCEECDDGNTENLDSCRSTCQFNFDPVPAVSEWGLFLLAILLATIGTIFLRRKTVSIPIRSD